MEGGKGIRVLWSTALTRLNRHRQSITRSKGQSSRIPTSTKVSTLRKQKQNGSLQVNETSQVSLKKKKNNNYFTPRVKAKTLDAFFLKHAINPLGISFKLPCC